MVTYSIWSRKLQTGEGVFSLTHPGQHFFHSTDAPWAPQLFQPHTEATSHPSRQKLVSPLGKHHSGLRNFTPTLCGFLPAMHK